DVPALSRGGCGPAPRRQRQGDRRGRGGGRTPQPLRISAPHELSPSNDGEMRRLPARHCGQDQGAFAAPVPMRVSNNSPITPATMATSARLKTYQLKLKLAVLM